MIRTREQIVDERRRLREQYRELFDQVSAVLFRHDPIGISFDNNPDEYEAEAGSILPRLRNCHSAEDALDVVHAEFVRWFDLATAGSREHYAKIAMISGSFGTIRSPNPPNFPATSHFSS